MALSAVIIASCATDRIRGWGDAKITDPRDKYDDWLPEVTDLREKGPAPGLYIITVEHEGVSLRTKLVYLPQ